MFKDLNGTCFGCNNMCHNPFIAVGMFCLSPLELLNSLYNDYKIFAIILTKKILLKNVHHTIHHTTCTIMCPVILILSNRLLFLWFVSGPDLISSSSISTVPSLQTTDVHVSQRSTHSAGNTRLTQQYVLYSIIVG